MIQYLVSDSATQSYPQFSALVQILYKLSNLDLVSTLESWSRIILHSNDEVLNQIRLISRQMFAGFLELGLEFDLNGSDEFLNIACISRLDPSCLVLLLNRINARIELEFSIAVAGYYVSDDEHSFPLYMDQVDTSVLYQAVMLVVSTATTPNLAACCFFFIKRYMKCNEFDLDAVLNLVFCYTKQYHAHPAVI